MAQRVSGVLGSRISWHSAHEGGEVVSLTHRPPLYSSSLGAESTPGPWYGRKEYNNNNNNTYSALGPVWQEPEPSKAIGMALVR